MPRRRRMEREAPRDSRQEMRAPGEGAAIRDTSHGWVWPYLPLTVIAVLAAIAAAARRAWVSDDAFISFRYARHLIEGQGLVFNPGERVEGYSNFLWTLLVAAAMRLGGDPVIASQVLGILCYAGTLALLAWSSSRVVRGSRVAKVVPVAALALAAHEHARLFATGGLETPLMTLLITALTVCTIEARTARGHAVAGLLAALAALTRPDGALYLLIPVLGAAPDLGRRRWQSLAASVAPMIALLAPYAAWKLAYYGDLLPNTFYAKGAGVPHLAQGLTYLRVYFTTYWILGLGIAVPLWRLASRRSAGRPETPSPWRSARAPGLILAATLLHLAFVVRVGGDFMFARFCVPVTPLLLIGAELLVLRLSSARVRWGYAVIVAAAVGFARVPELVRDRFNPAGIVEEWKLYPPNQVHDARRAGETLRVALAGTGARVAVYGSQAMLAYYGAFPVAIEAATGLTDREIARMPSVAGSRIGHEKAATLAYLQSRGVDFVFSFGLYQVKAKTSLNAIRIGAVDGVILTYDREVMNRLKGRPAVEFTDIERVLDQEIARLPGSPTEAIRQEYAWLKSFYFDRNRDPARETPFRRALGLGLGLDRTPAAP